MTFTCSTTAGDDRTQAFDRFGIWNYALEMREKGLLKHVGFSFHDKADVLEELLQKHPEMEFVQLQINYADWRTIPSSPGSATRWPASTASR